MLKQVVPTPMLPQAATAVCTWGLYGRLTPQTLARHWARDVSSGFHPQGTQPSGIFVHEMGHQIEAYLNRKDYGNAWSWGRSSSDIVLKAAKSIDSSIVSLNDPEVYRLAKEISGYAVDKRNRGNYPWAVWETLAEAVQDYGTNGSNAKPLSAAIWEELKRRTRR